MSKTIILILFFSLALSANIYGQLDTYSKYTALDGISQDWHLLKVPTDAYPYIKADLSDVRVFGVTQKNDTIEAAYILYRRDEQTKAVYVGHKQINESRKTNGQYYTWLVDEPGILNEILLDFDRENYDWKVNLEGSTDQQEWFTILEDYRILSIKNAETDYAFNRLIFPTSQYKYYRMLVKTDTDPKLTSTKTIQEVKKEGIYEVHGISRQDVVIDKAAKQTLIDIELHHAAPVSRLELSVESDFDYYRPVKIQYLADSVKTEKGYSYQYRTLARGTVSSVAANEYSFKSVICRKLRLVVSDGDNQPLKFRESTVKGSVYEMAVRFTESANYYLAYGNPKAVRPDYDIQNFAKSIPADISRIETGGTHETVVQEQVEAEPLIKNKIWLWLIMGLVILLLGYFTLSMLTKK